jgi:Terminase DNA packaging enzyme
MSTSSDDSPLANALGIALQEDQQAQELIAEQASAANLPVVILSPETITERKVEEDSDLARTTIREMIGKNNTAIDQLLDISRESMSPRAYEVLAGLIRHNADISEKLLKLHNDKTIVANNTINLARNKNAFLGVNTASTGNTTNIVNIDKAVFTGSTAELLELVRKAVPHQIEDQTVADEDTEGDLGSDVEAPDA